MFSTVLVGVDGKQGGRDAIALALQLVDPHGTIKLAHVAAPDLGGYPGLPVDHPSARREARELLEREREAAGIEAGLLTHCCVPTGRGLHELAELCSADLIVVGSSRRAVLGRALLGDDTQQALDGAHGALAVAPRGYAIAQRRLKTIGLGYDASPESEAALAVTRELAMQLGAAVTALWVVSLLEVREERPIPADWPAETAMLVAEHEERLQGLTGIEGHAIYGGPREELTRLSQNVDLLVVGSRGYGPWGRLFHGSVSSYLARHVDCPLLVLPRGGVAQAVPTPAQPAAVTTA